MQTSDESSSSKHPDSAMMANNSELFLESQLEQIDFLFAMYPSAGEIAVDAPTQKVINDLHRWAENTGPLPASMPSDLTLMLHLRLVVDGDDHNDDDNGKAIGPNTIALVIRVPLRATGDELVNDEGSLNLSIRQPSWMNRSDFSNLSAGIPPHDILSAVDYIQEEAPRYLKPEPRLEEILQQQKQARVTPLASIVRVWFYFPSLSTREKRDDLVNHAPTYDLTGFVLAGKPGVLCLEGTSKDIDAYMKFIKTESWGDIPSHQKKVSERYREDDRTKTETVKRVFDGMQEITDLLGERRGERANRGDMKALEAWLGQRGLGPAFEKVLM